MKIKTRIPVLFAHSRSNYKKIDLFDCYDKKRDAKTYDGKEAVIAHPPCRNFSRMRKFSKGPASEMELAYWAVDLVRQNGGIVEHPVSSLLWKHKKIPKEGVYDEYGGFIIKINQSWFGFHTLKPTILYIVGITMEQLPPYAINFIVPRAKTFDNMTAKQRSETTPELCYWLARIIRLIEYNKNKSLA